MNGPQEYSTRLATSIRTMMAAGFLIDRASVKLGYATVQCHRYDEFGVSVKYHFLLQFTEYDEAAVDALKRIANDDGANLVLVADDGKEGSVRWDDFLHRLGGPVDTWLPLEPDYEKRLVRLGANELPEGIQGRVDDLYEEYVHGGLQFLLGDRVIRYGQARRFETLPDGIYVPRTQVNVMYDAKAAKEGYKIDTDSVRQFGSYINDFHRKYQGYVGRLHCFLVISTDFELGGKGIEERSAELYAECQVPLDILRSHELAAAIKIIIPDPRLRSMIDWSKVFSRREVTAEFVRTLVAALQKDRIVT